MRGWPVGNDTFEFRSQPLLRPGAKMPMKRQKIDETNFDALEKLASQITPEKMRPLSPALRRRWNAAKRQLPRAG